MSERDFDAEIQLLQRRNTLGSITGTLTDEQRDELGDLYRERDRVLAQTLADVVVSASPDADIEVAEAEGAICERLDIPLDDTELGLTTRAVERIEAFVSQSLGTPWTYSGAYERQMEKALDAFLDRENPIDYSVKADGGTFLEVDIWKGDGHVYAGRYHVKFDGSATLLDGDRRSAPDR